MLNSFRRLGLLTSCAAVGLAAVTLDAQTSLDDSLNSLEKWVETESVISKEKADWEIQKQSMLDLLAVHRKELNELAAQIKAAEDMTSTADAQREALLGEQDSIRKIEARIKDQITAQEASLKKVIKKLPRPLQQEILPLSSRLPEDPDKTSLSLSQRMQNVVGILTQIDKFNTTVEVVPESRSFEDGKLVEVKTIYFGMAVAYYADTVGAHAGYGVPTDNGWEWQPDDSIAEKVQSIIEMAEGQTTDIKFVELPVTIKD